MMTAMTKMKWTMIGMGIFFRGTFLANCSGIGPGPGLAGVFVAVVDDVRRVSRRPRGSICPGDRSRCRCRCPSNGGRNCVLSLSPFRCPVRASSADQHRRLSPGAEGSHLETNNRHPSRDTVSGTPWCWAVSSGLSAWAVWVCDETYWIPGDLLFIIKYNEINVRVIVNMYHDQKEKKSKVVMAGCHFHDE